MRSATLQRIETSDAGTFGVLTTAEGFKASSLECPWRNNARRVSCIPAGSYVCRWHESPRFGGVYRLDGTAPREEILIHPGNWAGDAEQRYRTNSQGCILLGESRGTLAHQLAIIASRPTIDAFAQHMARETFLLHIEPIRAGAQP
ncbi:MAG TPA: DUF5675 family protein [Steroidobacteraceae bacterium]|nr:DUF5675 family protein [Steroidobacteraceae bacterium]